MSDDEHDAGAGVLATPDPAAVPGADAAAAAAPVAMAGLAGMDPAAYAQWVQALQAQQVAAQQMYLQQIAAAAGAAGGGVFALPQVAGLSAALPTAGLPQVAGLPRVALPLGGAVAAAVPRVEGPTYTGQVVDYNEDRGFGFIECKETQEIYGKDIFLLRSGLNGLEIATGDRVNFRVERGIKGPKAVEVEVVEKITDMADKLPRYWGIIKNFDNTRGLAFIECEELREVYDKDILALRTQIGDAGEGAVVSFNIVQDARGVKAANVKLHPEGFPPGMEPKPRPFKGKGKGKDFFGKGKDEKGFGKGFKGGKGFDGKGFNKGKFEELYATAANMLQDWGWYGGGAWDGAWGGGWEGGWEGGWDDNWWQADGSKGDGKGDVGKGEAEGVRFHPY